MRQRSRRVSLYNVCKQHNFRFYKTRALLTFNQESTLFADGDMKNAIVVYNFFFFRFKRFTNIYDCKIFHSSSVKIFKSSQIFGIHTMFMIRTKFLWDYVMLTSWQVLNDDDATLWLTTTHKFQSILAIYSNHPHRILIFGGSRYWKTNIILNLRKHVKDPFKSKYQLGINGREKVGIKKKKKIQKQSLIIHKQMIIFINI